MLIFVHICQYLSKPIIYINVSTANRINDDQAFIRFVSALTKLTQLEGPGSVLTHTSWEILQYKVVLLHSNLFIDCIKNIVSILT